MPFGYTGKILWVNLSEARYWEEDLPDSVYEQYLGGSGLAAYILYREIPPGIDALGAENVLAFVPGLLTNSGTFFSGRWMAAAKSPLTGTWGEANCGGNLAPAIKRAGYDGIFFKGSSPHQVFVAVENENVRVVRCAELWGLDTVETQIQLREKLGKKSAIACIGPSGESRSLIAGIVNDGARIAARSGLGAVMGSKNLKAIAVTGSEKTEVHSRAEVSRLNERVNRWVRAQPPLPGGKVIRYAGMLMRWLPFQIALDGWFYKLLLRKWGTVGFNQIAIEMGDAPIRNWKGTFRDFGFKRSGAIDPDHFIRRESRKYHCFACPLGCGGLIDGKHAVAAEHRPEYETVMAWSGLIQNTDTASLFQINKLLNHSGLDSISAGATVAFAIECCEKGLVSKEDLGGLELEWGNSAAILELLKKMIRREGIGAKLADGSLKAAARLEKGAEAYAMQAGGHELAFHDPRYDPGLALHAVVEASPGRHVRGAWQFYEMFRLWKALPDAPRARKFYPRAWKYRPDGKKARMAAMCSLFSQVLDGCGICLFGAFLGVDRLAVFEFIPAVIGWNITPKQIMQVGHRIQTLKQMFNAREGIPLRHSINKRLLGIPPLEHGSARSRQINLDPWVRGYWGEMGWDEETGRPTPTCLQDLGIVDFTDRYAKNEGGNGHE